MPIRSRRSNESLRPVVSRFVRATRLNHDDWGAIGGGTASTSIAWKMQQNQTGLHGVHAAAGDSVIAEGSSSSLATLLAGRVLRDGEVIHLILKPSAWFIAYQSFLFVAAVIGLWIAHESLGRPTQSHRRIYGEIAIIMVACRLMLATLQWMGRFYILTDQRVLRVAGVFNVEVRDCMLRKISIVQATASWYDRMLRIGNVDIHFRAQAVREKSNSISETNSQPDIDHNLAWQCVSRPIEVQDKINDAIRRLQ